MVVSDNTDENHQEEQLTTYLADYDFQNQSRMPKDGPSADLKMDENQHRSQPLDVISWGRQNKLRYEREKQSLVAPQDDVEPEKLLRSSRHF